MPSITLSWKTFTVDVNQVNVTLKSTLSSNYNGLVCDENALNVMFTVDIVQADSDAVNSYWNSVTSTTFQPTQQQLVALKIANAINFGNTIMTNYAAQNIIAGITQANMTQAVSDYCSNLQRYLQTGSLYAAVAEMDSMITTGVPSNLSPFVTSTIIETYKNQIQTYLGIPLT